MLYEFSSRVQIVQDRIRIPVYACGVDGHFEIFIGFLETLNGIRSHCESLNLLLSIFWVVKININLGHEFNILVFLL